MTWSDGLPSDPVLRSSRTCRGCAGSSVQPAVALDRFGAHAAGTIVPSRSALALLGQGGPMARGPIDHPIPWWLVHQHVLRFAMWTDRANDHRARRWARRLGTDLETWARGHVYPNVTTDQGADGLRDGLVVDSLGRLATVKADYPGQPPASPTTTSDPSDAPPRVMTPCGTPPVIGA